MSEPLSPQRIAELLRSLAPSVNGVMSKINELADRKVTKRTIERWLTGDLPPSAVTIVRAIILAAYSDNYVGSEYITKSVPPTDDPK